MDRVGQQKYYTTNIRHEKKKDYLSCHERGTKTRGVDALSDKLRRDQW